MAATIAFGNGAGNRGDDRLAFMAGENGTGIGHYHTEMVGRRLEGVRGTDAFEATGAGNWVTT